MDGDMEIKTLCLLVEDDQVLLAMKKRGFGAGRYNGYGGKQEEGDRSILHTAVRELEEESKIYAKEHHLKEVAQLSFFFLNNPEWNQKVFVYLVSQWTNEPKETEEMKPEWFSINKIPYDKMWEADVHWLPHVLEGKLANNEKGHKGHRGFGWDPIFIPENEEKTFGQMSSKEKDKFWRKPALEKLVRAIQKLNK